ncbi:MAG: class I SAM-dependent methyltransferase [Acidimicrobiales bacterium]
MAETYDRVRPSYPAELLAAIYEFAGLTPGRGARLCEVGAGTGKASMVVAPVAAEAGWSLTCIEPDPAMAAVLGRNLASVASLEYSIVVSGLEEFADGIAAGHSGEPRFDLLFAAQSWHWVSHDRRAADGAAVLSDGGTLALIWNVARPHPPDLRQALDRVYGNLMPGKQQDFPRLGSGSAVMPPSSPQPIGAGLTPGSKHEAIEEIERSGLFGPVNFESTHWRSSHSTQEWLALLQTHSDHRMLPEDVRTSLLERVGAAVDGLGGQVDVDYDAVAILAKRLAG